MKKRKLTWIDLTIVVVVIIGIIGYKNKIAKANVGTPATNKEKILITFYIEEIPDFAIDAINIGDPVRESIQNAYFGEVVDINPDDSIYWESREDGQLVSSSREGYSSLYITMQGTGIINKDGVSIDKSVYYVGQTISLNAGNSLLKEGRISEIKIAE